jgi:alpha-tubulin suppressor-like RCC1 family protein
MFVVFSHVHFFYAVNEDIKIMQMSAGVDISMAVTTTGDVFAWGKTDGGRNGLGMSNGIVSVPRRVVIPCSSGESVKAVDVDCGYVHSIIVALNGTIHVCGGVGIDGEDDGGSEDADKGKPLEVPNFNIWHRLAEPKADVKVEERWKKYGKYELKGRSKMLDDT